MVKCAPKHPKVLHKYVFFLQNQQSSFLSSPQVDNTATHAGEGMGTKDWEPQTMGTKDWEPYTMQPKTGNQKHQRPKHLDRKQASKELGPKHIRQHIQKQNYIAIKTLGTTSNIIITGKETIIIVDQIQ